MTFRQLLGTILEGDLTQAGKLFGIWCKDRLFYEIRTGRNTLKQLLLLAILAAILTNFSGLVRNRHISDIGFYLIYLMVITLSVSSFAAVLESAKEQMHLLTEFLKVLAPVYIFAVGLTCGLTTSAMFYHMLLVLIYLIELVAVQFLLPIIHVQVLVGVLNNLSEEDYLSKFGELLELGIKWTMKLMFSGVIGLNLVQGILGPALDLSLIHILIEIDLYDFRRSEKKFDSIEELKSCMQKDIAYGKRYFCTAGKQTEDSE